MISRFAARVTGAVPPSRGTDASSPRLRHHGPVTADPDPAPAGDLPPDPEAYDSARNEIARRRGLPQAYISGGDDPQIGRTLERERPYVLLLLTMAIAIVILGFALGMAGAMLPVPNV